MSSGHPSLNQPVDPSATQGTREDGAWEIGVDIGGTFTDSVVRGNGVEMQAKAASTGDYVTGVMDSLSRAAGRLDISLADLLARTERIVHGTTIATNTMIERTGSRTALITTAGHEDTLAIGRIYQKRAGLNDRQVTRMSHLRLAEPPLISRRDCLGLNERVDFRGEVLAPLHPRDIERALGFLADEDFGAVAICFLWSFLAPEHERAVADAIEQARPDLFVTTSHEIAPVLGEYERMVTTCLNAYLGPPMAAYLRRLIESLEESGYQNELELIQSSGRTIRAADVWDRAVLLLDSGPAAGSMAARSVGLSSGHRNLICTDVGGTSFDVALVLDGDIQQDKEPVIDKYVFKTPKVEIRSIGAGGGSIAWVDEMGTLRVGPTSAGAVPGPACYGRGGAQPTVTDAALILGYIGVEKALAGDLTLDLDAAREVFRPMALQLGLTLEDTASGVLEILSSQMADAIRSSTIERGLDPREFHLLAYGGAGGLYSAMYAAEAGIATATIPSQAGTFSALGMLLTPPGRMLERSHSIRTPFSATDADTISKIFTALSERARRELSSRDEDKRNLRLELSMFVRYQMQVHELEVPVKEQGIIEDLLSGLPETFREIYEGVYGVGSAYDEAGLEIVTYRLNAYLDVARQTHPAARTRGHPVQEPRTRQMYFSVTGWVEGSVRDEESLTDLDTIRGPAVIERYGDTILIPPGCTAQLTEENELSIHIEASLHRSTTDDLDPVSYEVIKNRLWAINDEQGMTAARISGTPIIYEAYDFNSGILDPSGRGVLAGLYVLYHTTGLDLAVDAVNSSFAGRIRDGDVFITNDPWAGAIHPSDMVVVAPVFFEDELVCWTAIVMHEMDVGGPVPGSFVVGATDVFSEVPLFPPLKLVDGGLYLQETHELLLRNSRTPRLNGLNLKARLASQSVAKRRITELCERYGRDTFLRVQHRIQEEIRTTVAQRLEQLPDGEWCEHSYIDHDGHENRLYEAWCTLRKEGDKLSFDFSGTSKQAGGFINGTISALRGGIMAALLPTLCHDVPWATGGLADVISIVSEEGTINNATHPAACTGGSIFGEAVTENLAISCIAKMLSCHWDLREDAMGCWYPYSNVVVLSGRDSRNEESTFVLMDHAGGGGGAGTFKDGIDCGGYLESVTAILPNVETNERVYPILEIYRKRKSDTSGAGMFRGGVGLEYMFTPHENTGRLADIVFGSAVSQPEAPGIYGGLPSSVQGNLIMRSTNVAQLLASSTIPASATDLSCASTEKLEAKDISYLDETDVHVSWVTGGAGYGDPIKREIDAIRRDVESGLISPETLEKVYGVVGSEFRRDSKSLADTRLSSARPVQDWIRDVGLFEPKRARS